MPKAVIIAGANGAGKTTFARNALPAVHGDCVFLNADEIQQEAPQFASPISAGREMLRRQRGLILLNASFMLETTLSSRMYAREIPTWTAAGYTIWLYFFEVLSADLSVARVAARVAAGGHGIPEVDIRRRHSRGITLFPAYRSLANVWYHFQVDQRGTTLVADQTP